MVQLASEVDPAGQGNVVIVSAEHSVRQDHVFVSDQLLPWLVQLQTAAQSLVGRLNRSQLRL